MGNTLNHCSAAPKRVKVYRDNGRLLQFRRPVTALQLMREHPNHLLVYSVVPARQTNVEVGKVSQHHVRIRVVRPGDVLHIGKLYFLVHIPEQYTAKFAKCFDAQSPTASPLSTFSSPSESPLSTYTPYTPSPPSGSIREMTRQANQQRLRNSVHANRIQSPASPSTLSNPDMMRSIINQHFRRDVDKSMRSPGRSVTPTQDKTNKHVQRRNQSRSTRSSGRSVTPGTQDTLRNFLQPQQQGGSPFRSKKSPGRSVTPCTEDTLRDILRNQERQRGSSPQYIKKSPRRSSKSDSGKPSRPRRGETRSPSHYRAALLPRSPGRSVSARVEVNEDVSVSCLRMFDIEFIPKSKDAVPHRQRSKDAAPAPAPTPPRAPAPAPRGTFLPNMMPRLMRNRSVRYPWAPALGSISENSPERGSAEELIKSFTPSHLFMSPVSVVHRSR